MYIWLPDQLFCSFISYCFLFICFFYALNKITAVDQTHDYFKISNSPLPMKFRNEHDRIWIMAKKYIGLFLCLYSIFSYIFFFYLKLPWYLVLFLFCSWITFLWGLKVLILRYYAWKGISKKLLYCKIAAYLQTLVDYLYRYICIITLQTKVQKKENEDEWEWKYTFLMQNKVTWFIILKLLFFMFIYTRVINLVPLFLDLAYRSPLTLKEILKNFFLAFGHLFKYFWITFCNFFIFWKYVWYLKEFDQPKRIVVAQWYDTIKTNYEKYADIMLMYQDRLQKDNIYELCIVLEIRQSPTSAEQDFKIPFYTMSFMVAIFTFVRVIPFLAITNILIKSLCC